MAHRALADLGPRQRKARLRAAMNNALFQVNVINNAIPEDQQPASGNMRDDPQEGAEVAVEPIHPQNAADEGTKDGPLQGDRLGIEPDPPPNVVDNSTRDGSRQGNGVGIEPNQPSNINNRDEPAPRIDGPVHVDWDNFIQQLHLNNRHEDVVLIGEPANIELFNEDNGDDNRRNFVDEIINMNTIPDGENENNGNEDDDDSDDDNGGEYHDQENQGNIPLYHNAPLTVAESMLALLQLKLRHNLSKECLADVIRLLELHCPQVGLIKNSMYKFEKFWNIDDEAGIKKYYYCSICLRELENAADVCRTCEDGKCAFFLELKARNQLREMYKRRDFNTLLQERFKRPAHRNQRTISDVYDGQLYQEWVNKGFLSNRNNISFTWYTDGVPVYKSSQISVWPIYLSINELPFNERRKQENTILLALWYGNSKPHFNFVFYKLRKEIISLYNGFEVTLPDGSNITVRGVLLIGTCDLPAKCDCLNFIQYNGSHGCPVCFFPGRSIRTGPRSALQTYPYTRQFEMRTSQRCIEYAMDARPNAPVYGVKGPTALSRLMADFIRGMAIDRMHGVDGGGIKKLLTLWFSSTYSGCDFSLINHTGTINARLKALKPPKFIHRMPRSVDELVHWKASELKHFFFYYAVPVLEGVMEDKYLQNFLQLIVGTMILSGDEIEEMMIDVADDLLNCFVRDFEELYTLNFCSINIHLLLHLADCVRRLGPLWAYSCYEYEDLNGKILKFVNGTWHLESQIATSHWQRIKMMRFVEELPENPLREFCTRQKHQVKIIEKVGEHLHSVGRYTRLERIPALVERALVNVQINPAHFNIWQYFRLLKNNKLYVAEAYRRKLQTRSSIVQYSDNGIKYGVINRFLRLRSNQCQHNNCNCGYRHVAILRDVDCQSAFRVRGENHEITTAGWIHRCGPTNFMKAIPVDALINPCVAAEVEDRAYLMVPINNKEFE